MAYQNLPPVSYAQVTTAQRDLLDKITGLVIFNLDTSQPEMCLYDRWSPFVMAFGQPNFGDSLSWDSASGHYISSPSRTPIIESLKIYSDSVSSLEVKRFYSGNTKTGTGTGTMKPTGSHSLLGSVNKSYRVQIDSAGTSQWQDATMKWSDDGGTTFQEELVPIALGVTGSKTLVPITIAADVTVLFSTGTYVAADRWDFVAIAASNQLYDLQVDTTNSIVKVGTTLRIANDPNFYLNIATNPQIVFDSLDLIGYDRAANEFSVIIGANFRFTIGGSVVDIKDNAVLLTDQGIPTTPAANRSKLYARASFPRWLDSAGLEQNMLPLTTKGDLYGFSTTAIRKAVGADGTLLSASSADATGLAWVTHGATGDPHTQYAQTAGDTFTGDIAMTGGRTIHTGTADAADNSFLYLTGGGAQGSTRGGTILLCGNEIGLGLNIDGLIQIIAGNDTTGHIQMYTGAAVLRYEITDDAKMGWFAATPVVQQTSGANLTNNVTAGGSNDVIADYSSLTVYATDAAAIRNDIYQLSRKLKQINDGLRAYGLFT